MFYLFVISLAFYVIGMIATYLITEDFVSATIIGIIVAIGAGKIAFDNYFKEVVYEEQLDESPFIYILKNQYLIINDKYYIEIPPDNVTINKIDENKIIVKRTTSTMSVSIHILIPKDAKVIHLLKLKNLN